MSHQLKSLLACNHELHPLLKKAHELNVLQNLFIGVAPSYFAQSSQVLSLQQGTLTIAVANATMAAKLRQLAPEMATLLQGRGYEISGIRVKVQVSYNLNQPKPLPRSLGKMAQRSLNELSQNLPKNSTLKLALENLINSKD